LQESGLPSSQVPDLTRLVSADGAMPSAGCCWSDNLTWAKFRRTVLGGDMTDKANRGPFSRRGSALPTPPAFQFKTTTL
jgi:hypothetical protein